VDGSCWTFLDQGCHRTEAKHDGSRDREGLVPEVLASLFFPVRIENGIALGGMSHSLFTGQLYS
jgi:hypothetical protein